MPRLRLRDQIALALRDAIVAAGYGTTTPSFGRFEVIHDPSGVRYFKTATPFILVREDCINVEVVSMADAVVDLNDPDSIDQILAILAEED
jgi:hypothetical protein